MKNRNNIIVIGILLVFGVPVVHGQWGPTKEIGRASCRERV